MTEVALLAMQKGNWLENLNGTEHSADMKSPCRVSRRVFATFSA